MVGPSPLVIQAGKLAPPRAPRYCGNDFLFVESWILGHGCWEILWREIFLLSDPPYSDRLCSSSTRVKSSCPYPLPSPHPWDLVGWLRALRGNDRPPSLSGAGRADTELVVADPWLGHLHWSYRQAANWHPSQSSSLLRQRLPFVVDQGWRWAKKQDMALVSRASSLPTPGPSGPSLFVIDVLVGIITSCPYPLPSPLQGRLGRLNETGGRKVN